MSSTLVAVGTEHEQSEKQFSRPTSTAAAASRRLPAPIEAGVCGARLQVHIRHFTGPVSVVAERFDYLRSVLTASHHQPNLYPPLEADHTLLLYVAAWMFSRIRASNGGD